MKALLAALCLVILPPAVAMADVAVGDGGTSKPDDNKTGCSHATGQQLGALAVASTFSALFLLNRKKRDS